GESLGAPVIKGDTTVTERQRLFQAFRTGEIGLLVVSKVANFSIDLPEASVAIQVSGSFGSRQEEAQRLGRVLRPKGDGRAPRFSAQPTMAAQVCARSALDWRVVELEQAEVLHRDLEPDVVWASRPLLHDTADLRRRLPGAPLLVSLPRQSPPALVVQHYDA